MEAMYYLIPVSLIVLVAVGGLLVWAVNSGQYDDIEREGERILQDDDLPEQEGQAQSGHGDGPGAVPDREAEERGGD